MDKVQNCNKVTLTGKLENIHSLYDDKLYECTLISPRLSGKEDSIPIHISNIFEYDKDKPVIVTGQLRSTMINNKLKLYLFVTEIKNYNNSPLNNIDIEGYICKKPFIRKTPLGKTITDLFIACNYNKNKTAYIPCIAWGTTAKELSLLDKSELIKINGRIQSRNYNKEINEKTTYEVSISSYEII